MRAAQDLFGEIYRNQLAKRLLNARSASDDAERSMVSKLKLKCGVQFTGKMEGMMMDLVLGGDVQRKFTAWLPSSTEALPIEFGVQVLTTGFWPSFKPTRDLLLPAVMDQCQHGFQTFYSAETQHRKLNWVHSLGTATVRDCRARAGLCADPWLRARTVR
jgi:cullin 1